ncbi:uncharacterized protein LOC123879138 [Maniola jurtina]|uniref:uncharacterized protein LOC123879138 n=1 Tax=Maniola jurtina TaxID=191418 RepID=UPI001E68BF10|nr:uncharacterized protein LOC123879138 [Maniola jurtina]
MAQGGSVISLGELLQVQADSEKEDEVLERLKLLAQENLPEGWTDWTARHTSKEDIVGSSVDPQLLNKLRFALPTVGLAKAFNPDADHLSEKCYRDIKVKMLDWEFTRALIISPPAVANKIRGSAAQAELFNRAIEVMKPSLISRPEADRLLSGGDSDSERRARKRSSSSGSFQSKRSRVDELEQKMDSMFAVLVEKIENLGSGSHSQQDEISDAEDSDQEVFPPSPESGSDSGTWKAPAFDPGLEFEQEGGIDVLDFRPMVKEAEPPVPEPSSQARLEGIECQRFGSESWSRLRYKEVEKRLHAAPVFSTLKVNTELGGMLSHPSALAARQDGMLGTIVHGLLLQRRVLSEELKTLAKKHPEAAGDLRSVLADGSRFKVVSDDLLQFTCGHRAETIEMRRKAFKARNENLSASLQQIPPSATHLFEEKRLTDFVRDNGGVKQVFLSPQQFKRPFRKPAASAAQATSKQPTWRSRPTAPPKTSQVLPKRGSAHRTAAARKYISPKKGSDKRRQDKRY